MVFAPKDKHLSGSMSLSDQVTLIIIIDFIGYAQGISEVMEELGCPLPALTIEFLKWCNEKCQYDKVYHASLDFRWWRGMEKWQKIINHLCHLVKDEKDGYKYGPSIAVAAENVHTMCNANASNKELPNEANGSSTDAVSGGKKLRMKRSLLGAIQWKEANYANSILIIKDHNGNQYNLFMFAYSKYPQKC